IIDAAVETNATAIGLSALLVSTSKQMPLCVKELHHQGLKFPVLIGGAAINRQFGYRTLFVDDDTPYPAGVFYARDAFEGLAIMDRLIDEKERQAFLMKTVAEARAALNRPGREAFSVPDEAAATTGRTVREVEPPTPPFWGVRELDGVRLA